MKCTLATLVAVFLMLFSFAPTATASGEAYTNPIAPPAGHDQIVVTSTENITVEAVLELGADGIWRPMNEDLYAKNPDGSVKIITISFANEFNGTTQYKIKYKWVGSATPSVGLTSPT